MSQRGPAVVRFSLLLLVFAAFAMALVQPSQAGTEAAPEIQDPAHDQELADQAAQPACGTPAGTACMGSRIDYTTVYITDETAADFKVYMVMSNVPAGALTAAAEWSFHATFGGTEVVSTATAAGGQNANPPPVPQSNLAAATVDGNTLIFTIAKSVYGAPAVGSKLTDIFLTGRSITPTPVPATLASDRAPNTGGVEYTFTGGGNSTVPGDSDNDGLNDTCEQQYFGGLNSTHNATGDADGDGLTNGQECVGGTDPTKADTDGDGTGDKDDPFPTDPTKGGASSGSSSSSGSRSSSSSRSTSASDTSSGGSSSTSDQAGGDGEVKNLDDAIERLRSDAGYVGLSAGGFLTVVVLAILALAVRWSL
jgi:hypothetical protein